MIRQTIMRARDGVKGVLDGGVANTLPMMTGVLLYSRYGIVDLVTENIIVGYLLGSVDTKYLRSMTVKLINP